MERREGKEGTGKGREGEERDGKGRQGWEWRMDGRGRRGRGKKRGRERAATII